MAAAVLTHYTSILNSTTTLYVCDIHESYIDAAPDVRRLNLLVSIGFVIISIALVPVYAGTQSIINLVQQLNGLLSMPILSAFIVGLVFKGVRAEAVMAALAFGVGLYAIFTWVWTPLHYIHLMLVTLIACIAMALGLNRLFGGRAVLARA
jgi:SSS family solute:Na+ symporter